MRYSRKDSDRSDIENSRNVSFKKEKVLVFTGEYVN